MEVPPAQPSAAPERVVHVAKKSREEQPDTSAPSTATSAREGRLIVRGLPNLGNTCYFNSTIQCLASLSPVVAFAFNRPARPNEGEVLTAFRRLCVGAQANTREDIVSPGELLGLVSRKARRFQGRNHQDAQELLRVLLGQIDDEEIMRMKQKLAAAAERGGSVLQQQLPTRLPPTFIARTFGGALLSVITCKECGGSSVACDPFLDASLAIPGGAPEASGADEPAPFGRRKRDAEDAAPLYRKGTPVTASMAKGTGGTSSLARLSIKELRAKKAAAAASAAGGGDDDIGISIVVPRGDRGSGRGRPIVGAPPLPSPSSSRKKAAGAAVGATDAEIAALARSLGRKVPLLPPPRPSSGSPSSSPEHASAESKPASVTAPAVPLVTSAISPAAGAAATRSSVDAGAASAATLSPTSGSFAALPDAEWIQLAPRKALVEWLQSNGSAVQLSPLGLAPGGNLKDVKRSVTNRTLQAAVSLVVRGAIALPAAVPAADTCAASNTSAATAAVATAAVADAPAAASADTLAAIVSSDVIVVEAAVVSVKTAQITSPVVESMVATAATASVLAEDVVDQPPSLPPPEDVVDQPPSLPPPEAGAVISNNTPNESSSATSALPSAQVELSAAVPSASAQPEAAAAAPPTTSSSIVAVASVPSFASIAAAATAAAPFSDSVPSSSGSGAIRTSISSRRTTRNASLWTSTGGYLLPPPVTADSQPSAGSAATTTLLDCLTAFTAPEALSAAGGNGYRCANCVLVAAAAAEKQTVAIVRIKSAAVDASLRRAQRAADVPVSSDSSSEGVSAASGSIETTQSTLAVLSGSSSTALPVLMDVPPPVDSEGASPPVVDGVVTAAQQACSSTAPTGTNAASAAPRDSVPSGVAAYAAAAHFDSVIALSHAPSEPQVTMHADAQCSADDAAVPCAQPASPTLVSSRMNSIGTSLSTCSLGIDSSSSSTSLSSIEEALSMATLSCSVPLPLSSSAQSMSSVPPAPSLSSSSCYPCESSALAAAAAVEAVSAPDAAGLASAATVSLPLSPPLLLVIPADSHGVTVVTSSTVSDGCAEHAVDPPAASGSCSGLASAASDDSPAPAQETNGWHGSSSHRRESKAARNKRRQEQAAAAITAAAPAAAASATSTPVATSSASTEAPARRGSNSTAEGTNSSTEVEVDTAAGAQAAARVAAAAVATATPPPPFRNASKRIVFGPDTPAVLTVQLKRFASVGVGGGGRHGAQQHFAKIGKAVRFPEVLNLTPFCARRAPEVDPLLQQQTIDSGAPAQSTGDVSTGSDAAVLPSDGGDVLYRLSGVVVHYGSLNSGHYVAYVRHGSPEPFHHGDSTLSPPCGQTWSLISDSSVSESSLAAALAAEAYILFYERVVVAVAVT